VSVSVRDARSAPADKRWIAGVYRTYLDDLSPQNTGVFPTLDEVGHTEPDQLDRWFSDPLAHPLVILQSGTPCGFAMVARNAGGAVNRGAQYRMAEFFIRRESRRLGVGRGAVPLILDRFAGSWEIIEYQRNPAAVQFWRSVVAHYTGGDYRERAVDGEVRHSFVSRSVRLPAR
jgi:predicted acetyltransferase